MELRDRLKPSTAVLLVVLVVCSSAASVTALAGQTATAPAAESAGTDAPVTMAPDNESVEPADEIYVSESGDAVLVYEQSQDDEESATATGHLGLNVSQGLMHVLVRDEIEDETNVTGDAQFILTPEALTGNGSFQAPRPETLENLEADVNAQRTPSDMSAEASLDMTYRSESEYSTASQVESASTSGTMSLSADEFTTTGTANVEFSQDIGVLQKRQYTVEEGTDQYRLQASEEYYVSSYAAEQWETRSKAQRTLETQYASIATQLGGSADVTIQSYDYATVDGRNKLDIEYEIVYSNIDDQLSQLVAQSLVNDEELEVSQETAEAVGDGIADVNVDRVHANIDAEGKTANTEWDVQLSNYDGLVRAGFDLAEEASEDENVTEQIQDARKNYDAAQASDLTQTLSWEGSLESLDAQTVEVSATMEYDTENYEAFVSEREARDLPTGGTYAFEASAQTEGEQVVAEMELTVDQEDLVDQSLDSLMQSASTSDTGSDNAQRFVEAFQRSEFQKAKMNVDVTEENVKFQAGAKFSNMESFQSVMEEEFGGDISSMYANVGEDSKAYVHVTGAFSGDVSESTVREHSAVDEETTVNMPGQWSSDEVEFPMMDRDAAREYLGIEDDQQTTTGTATDDGTDAGTDDGTSDENPSSSGLPGFGVPAAFAAVAAVAALLLGRMNRRDD